MAVELSTPEPESCTHCGVKEDLQKVNSTTRTKTTTTNTTKNIRTQQQRRKRKNMEKQHHHHAHEHTNEHEKEDEEEEDRCRLRYFERLLHTCRKDVHKCVKNAQRLECQKLARHVKQQQQQQQIQQPMMQQTQSTNQQQQQLKQQKSQKLLERYQSMKTIDLGRVESIVLRRLGILPPPAAAAAAAAASATTRTAPPLLFFASSANTEPHIQRLLQHKRVRDTMEKWTEQVTAYRRWCVRRDEWSHNHSSSSKKSKSASTSAWRKNDSSSAMENARIFQSSVFTRLGHNNTGSDDGSLDDNDNDDEYDYNYDDDEDEDNEENDGNRYGSEQGNRTNKNPKLKLKPLSHKNRPGQRARKAKAEAIQAKKEGRKIDQSLNWRQPKSKTHHSTNTAYTSTNTNTNSRARTTNDDTLTRSRMDNNNNNKNDEKTHPSWQAASQKKMSIVPYQGTKIKFC